jgi:hypothetical protein
MNLTLTAQPVHPIRALFGALSWMGVGYTPRHDARQSIFIQTNFATHHLDDLVNR